MIYVRVNGAGTPFCWVRRARCLHVFMQLLLQIDSHLAKRSNNHVGADACFNGDVPVGIINLHVGGIVARRDSSLRDSSVDKLFELRWSIGRERLENWLRW